MSSPASVNSISENDVENYFRCHGEASTSYANRQQRRRLVEASSQLWRSLVSAAPPQSTPVGTPVSQNAPGAMPSSGSSGSLSGLGSSGSGLGGGGSATSFRAAKEQGAILALTSNAATGLLLRPRSLGLPQNVEIGKTTLSETERWKLQAALRREETKQSGERYNQNMLRETKVTKVPTPGEAFPAGRGRPVR